MPGLIDNYLREVEASLRADPARKRHIVEELRAHLHEKVADLQRAHPERSREDVEREVLHDIGSARDLALGYEPEGTEVLRNRAGDTVLRLGQAVGRGAKAAGRGAGKVLKVVAITLAVVLVVAMGVGAWAFYEFKPQLLAMANDASPVYSYSETCRGAPCDGSIPTATFHVHDDARQVRFEMDLWPTYSSGGRTQIGGGGVSISVSDPNGGVAFERTLNMTNATRVHHDLTWAAVPGNWTIAVQYDQFVGEVHLHARTWSAPWAD